MGQFNDLYVIKGEKPQNSCQSLLEWRIFIYEQNKAIYDKKINK